jgi:Tfp pilus assembly protein FimT
MLVVIAIIGILSALAVPAFRGLAGSSGVRGGTDTILGAMNNAQSAALESGANAFLAFPNDTFSRFIVLTQNATGQTNLATPRWFKLPTGIQVAFSNTNNLFANISATLPPIDGSNAPTTVRAIRYDRFGSLRGTGTLDPNLRLVVGEGFSDASGTTWTGPAESRSTFAAQPLIGKWTPTNN